MQQSNLGIQALQVTTDCNAMKATKNICYVKGESTVDNNHMVEVVLLGF